MNKIETIRTLLESPSIYSVEVNQLLTFRCPNKFMSHIKEFGYHIDSFTENWCEWPKYGLGDLVYTQYGSGEVMSHNGLLSHHVMVDGKIRDIPVHQIALLSKAEL